jgi:hypothetical protein
VGGDDLNARELTDAVRVIQRQPKSSARTAVMPGEEEFPETELLHDFYLILRHAPERVVAVIGLAPRFGAVTVAAQVTRHHGEVFSQSRRDLVPGRVRQWVPMQEQEPWARATIAQVDCNLWVTGLKLEVFEAFEHVRLSYCVDLRTIHRHREVWYGSLELHDGPSGDLSTRQGVARLVDLVQRIASSHQPVQWQPALSEPPDEHGEVAVRSA